MPKDVDREQVKSLVEDGAQLVDVLPAREYNEWHLPGAIHLSLKKLTAETAGRLDRGRPVIVYCSDYQ
jgi:rhodanese-related sulfurtransferase